MLEWMRRDWDERAARDAEFYVYTRGQTAGEGDFEESGRVNYRQLVRPYLPILLNGRPAKACRVVEIGCGVGRMTRWFAEDFLQVHGLDISAEMVERARLRLRGFPNVALHMGSGHDLQGLPDGGFELVFSYIVFQHIPSREVIESYVRESARVLRPGGFFKFQVQGDLSAEYRRQKRDTWMGETFSAAEVDQVLPAAGFSRIASEGAGTQYFLITARKGSAFDRPGIQPYIYPGETWAEEQLLEGWREPVGASWRCVWARSRTLLAAPPGERRRLFAGLYFRPAEPFEPLDFSIAVNDVILERAHIVKGGDYDWNLGVPAGVLVGGDARVTMVIDPPPDPSIGPAIRCLGTYAES
ncbi:MAG TPA: class I SAM-dependent methyltransferase [Bryobacterales bacterium]|nr:class I SAM-dependent methyltransferase [Bryobacterales bacterium]